MSAERQPRIRAVDRVGEAAPSGDELPDVQDVADGLEVASSDPSHRAVRQTRCPSATRITSQSRDEADTFQPLSHVRKVTKTAGATVAGYLFGPGGVTEMKDLDANSRRDFALAYKERPFNFEYDMELLQTLPLDHGYDVSIPFYDAGIDKTADRYEFKVAGSARITGWNGLKEDCWLVTADYNSGVVKSRFWFDKRTHVLVREEAPQENGGLLIKTLLPPESSDEA